MQMAFIWQICWDVTNIKIEVLIVFFARMLQVSNWKCKEKRGMI